MFQPHERWKPRAAAAAVPSLMIIPAQDESRGAPPPSEMQTKDGHATLLRNAGLGQLTLTPSMKAHLANFPDSRFRPCLAHCQKPLAVVGNWSTPASESDRLEHFQFKVSLPDKTLLATVSEAVRQGRDGISLPVSSHELKNYIQAQKRGIRFVRPVVVGVRAGCNSSEVDMKPVLVSSTRKTSFYNSGSSSDSFQQRGGTILYGGMRPGTEPAFPISYFSEMQNCCRRPMFQKLALHAFPEEAWTKYVVSSQCEIPTNWHLKGDRRAVAATFSAANILDYFLTQALREGRLRCSSSGDAKNKALSQKHGLSPVEESNLLSLLDLNQQGETVWTLSSSEAKKFITAEVARTGVPETILDLDDQLEISFVPVGHSLKELQKVLERRKSNFPDESSWKERWRLEAEIVLFFRALTAAVEGKQKKKEAKEDKPEASVVAADKKKKEGQDQLQNDSKGYDSDDYDVQERNSSDDEQIEEPDEPAEEEEEEPDEPVEEEDEVEEPDEPVEEEPEDDESWEEEVD